MSSKEEKHTNVQHTVSSQCASALSTIILYPLDVVKMRFMSQDGTIQRRHNSQYYQSILSAFKSIAKNEGRVRPFFRGCHVAVLGSVCAWGIYMFTYRYAVSLYKSYREGSGQNEPSPFSSKWFLSGASLDDIVQRFGLSIFASAFSALCCNPIWVLKTRMQLEEVVSHQKSAHTAGTEVSSNLRGAPKEMHYNSFCGGVRYALRTGGVRSLYRGITAQLLLGVPMALNLPLYDTIKSYLLKLNGTDTLSSGAVVFCSFTSRTVLLVVTHPIVVAKTRLQDHRAHDGHIKYKSFSQTVKSIYVNGGVKDFYRGMVPSFVQSVPRTVLTFVFYEYFLNMSKRVGA